MAASTAAPRPILIIGPTASGKSALALALAERLPRPLIVNADALQVYDGWRSLTARPDAAALGRAEHALYGHVDPADARYSTGRWLREFGPLFADASAAGRAVIVVGGTGLYLKALTEGLAAIPEIPAAIRSAMAAEVERDLAAAAARLSAEDPRSAARVDLRNPRRVQRALEVLAATGKGLAAWAAETPPPLLPATQAVAARITVDRATLRARIARRLRAMAAEGALEEVARMRERIAARGLDWDLPAMKALGARSFAAHLDGEATLQEAIEAAALETGRYAKRQDTWARNQFPTWAPLDWGTEPTAHCEKSAQILSNAALERPSAQ